MFKFIKNLFFVEDINEAQYKTAIHFAKKTFITHSSCNEKTALYLAVKLVDKWIVEDVFNERLKELWANTKVA